MSQGLFLLELIRIMIRILINNGDIFDGNQDQFRDCFFDNASLENIVDWCKDEGFSFEAILEKEDQNDLGR